MIQNCTSFRKMVMRGLWMTALSVICGLSIAGASSTAALAQPVGIIQGCIYRGPGFGYWGGGFCYPYAYGEASVCRVVRQRVKTPTGWKTRLIDVCE